MSLLDGLVREVLAKEAFVADRLNRLAVKGESFLLFAFAVRF